MYFSKRALFTTALLGLIQFNLAANPLEKIIGQEASKLQQQGKEHVSDKMTHGHQDDRRHDRGREKDEHHGQHGSGQTCKQERGLRSVQGNVHTTMNFINKRDHEIRTYWLDYQGRRVFYKALPSKGQHTQPTYQTHPWVVTDQRDNCIGVFVSNSPSGTAEIR